MKLTSEQKAGILYHDIFDYPLSGEEVEKWKLDVKIKNSRPHRLSSALAGRQNFWFVKGRERIVEKRLRREKYSEKKMKIARKAGMILGRISSVKMVAITGSLAMKNAKKNDDIDLMVVTAGGCLWSTRILVYAVLFFAGFKTRRFGQSHIGDKLCLNLWMDEQDLGFDKKMRSIYLAHEVAQIIPIVNKNKTYEKFLGKNKWIKNYWPKAIKISPPQVTHAGGQAKLKIIESIAYWLQYFYMRKKITRETITRTRAMFHPVHWGEKVEGEMRTRGLYF